MRYASIPSILAAALLVGCGDPADTTTRAGATSGSEAASARGSPGKVPVPRVESVGIAPSVPSSGDVVRAHARTSGPGPHRLRYTWQVGGRMFEDETGSMELPRLRKGEIVAVEVRATNASGTSDPVRHEVRIGNTPPQLVDLRLFERADDGQGPAWVAEPVAKDPDGDRLVYEYTWFVDDRQHAHDGPALPVSELRRGNRVRVQVRASDGQDTSDLAESGTIEVENTSPTIVSRPPPLDDTGLFHYEMKVEDADGDRRFRFGLVRSPRGMKVDLMSGKVEWKPELDQAGIHPVEISVSDYHGGQATQSFRLPIAVRSEDPAPAAPADGR